MSTIAVDTINTTGGVTVDTIKAWAHASADQTTVNDSLNLTSLTDTGTGDCTWNWANNFGSGYYTSATSCETVIAASSATFRMDTMQDTPAAGSLRTVDAYGGNVAALTYSDYVTKISSVGDLA